MSIKSSPVCKSPYMMLSNILEDPFCPRWGLPQISSRLPFSLFLELVKALMARESWREGQLLLCKGSVCPSALKNIPAAIAKPDCRQKGLPRTPEPQECTASVRSVTLPCSWVGAAKPFRTGMCPGACDPALAKDAPCSAKLHAHGIDLSGDH